MTKAPLLLTAMATLLPGVTLASYPTLTPNSNYVSVEIREGTDNQAAEQMSVQYQGKATKGSPFRGAEGARLCGRREAVPGSAGGGWSSWYCASGTKGIQDNKPSNTNF